MFEQDLRIEWALQHDNRAGDRRSLPFLGGRVAGRNE
jgi:hypothetical protein